jgi:hypothetical protein
MTHFSPLNDANAEFAIVPVSEGKPPQNAIAHGSMSAVMERVADSKARKDAEAVIARAGQAAAELEQHQQREQAAVDDGVRKIADSILKLTHRIDQLEQERETRRALNAATEVTQQMLAIPKDAPDPEAPDDEFTPAPGGELSPLPPSHPEDKEQLAASEDQGNLPPERLEGAPPPSGTAPTIGFEDARRSRARPYKTAPHTYPQVAVSLNEV